MKRLLSLLILLVFGHVSFAQTKADALQPDLKNAELLKRWRANEWQLPQIDTGKNKLGNRLALERKPGVYSLPQDNMPCIVPDLSQTALLPNAWKRGVTVPFDGAEPKIPNPGKRPRLGPSRPLLILPEQNDVTK